MEELNKSISTVFREDTMRELEAIANEDFGGESEIIGLSTVIRYAVYKLISDLSSYENTDRGFKEMMDELKTINKSIDSWVNSAPFSDSNNSLLITFKNDLFLTSVFRSFNTTIALSK